MAAAEGFAVNGPASNMYRVKPHYKALGPIEVPTCMYKLEYNHGQKGEQSASESADNVKLSVVDELERRQERILCQIEDLQRQVEDLMKEQSVAPVQLATTTASKARLQVGRTKIPPAPAAVVAAPSSKLLDTCPKTCAAALDSNKSDNIKDLVISATPSIPPLSLLVLQQMLMKQFSVLSASHVHSSAMSSAPASLRDLYQAGNALPSNRNAYQIGITVVWKEDKYSPVLKVNPSDQTPIIGECNIARYLARLLSPPYDSGDAVTSTRIDAAIDLADAQLSNDGAQKANFVKMISAQLGKSRWMLGEELSLADVVLWSAVYQLKQASRAPDNVKRWLEACNQLPEFAFAKQFV